MLSIVRSVEESSVLPHGARASGYTLYIHSLHAYSSNTSRFISFLRLGQDSLIVTITGSLGQSSTPKIPGLSAGGRMRDRVVFLGCILSPSVICLGCACTLSAIDNRLLLGITCLLHHGHHSDCLGNDCWGLTVHSSHSPDISVCDWQHICSNGAFKMREGLSGERSRNLGHYHPYSSRREVC